MLFYNNIIIIIIIIIITTFYLFSTPPPSAGSRTGAYHIQFCNGDKIDISCPKDWQIHLSSAYYVYVHGVQLGGPNCRQHTNSSKQCLRKIQFYDPDYFSLMIQSCQSKQRCEEGLVARIGDPKVCWDFPRSPSDYLIFSYVCVNGQSSSYYL